MNTTIRLEIPKLLSDLDALKLERLPLPLHIASKCDEHSRETYATMLAALLLAKGAVSENQSRLFKMLISSLQLGQIQARLYEQALALNQDQLREFFRVIDNNQLAHSFFMDALVLCRLDQPLVEAQHQILSELVDLLYLPEKDVPTIANLAAIVLGLPYETNFADDFYYTRYNVWEGYYLFRSSPPREPKPLPELSPDTPPIPPHKVPLESIVILDRRADTPNVGHITQLSTILELTETISQPTLITFYKEIVLPVANEYNSDIIHDMDLFTATDTMLELRDVLTSVSEKDSLGRFTTLITSMIEAAVVEALIYRYNVPAMIRFPYLTHPKKCNELLYEYGIKAEIEAIALDVIRPMSPSCVYTSIGLLDDVLTTHNDIIEIDEAAGMVRSNRVVLTASMPSPVLVLPDDYTYDYLNEELLSKNEKANNEISALFQVAFQMVDPTVVSIEIYDASLRKFKVTQLGIPSDLNTFKVVPM